MPQVPAQRRILVVDDNRDAADLLAEVLAMHGHLTEAAYDGRAGLAAVELFQPDIVLLDIGMPELNGYEVATRVRQLELEPQPVLIAFTAWNDDEARARVIAAGFDLHLTKPMDMDRLLETVLHAPPAPLPL